MRINIVIVIVIVIASIILHPSEVSSIFTLSSRFAKKKVKVNKHPRRVQPNNPCHRNRFEGLRPS